MTHHHRPLRATVALVLALAAPVAFAAPAAQAKRAHHTQKLRLQVRGHKLVWSRARGVHRYVLRANYPARHVRRVVRRNSIRLPHFRSTRARYTVRIARRGSHWAAAVYVVFGSNGNIARVERGGWKWGGREHTPKKTGGREELPKEEGAKGEEAPETGSHTLKVGLIGGVVGWGAGPSETIRKQTGVRFTRVEIGGEGWAQPKELVEEGVTPLIDYNPGLQGMSPSAVAKAVAGYATHMQELGLTELELGNEVYYHGSTPGEYAAQYDAAHKALQGTGIKLIADIWTDTYDAAHKAWSQWESGGGWGVMVVQALGYVPDAWSFHPYGPMNANGFGSGAFRTGWATVPRMISYMKQDHIYAPINITEVGQPVWQGADGNAAVTEAEQTADVRQYIRQAAEWGLNSVYMYEGIDTGEGGYGLYKWPLQARPSAKAFAESVATYSEKPAMPGQTAAGLAEEAPGL